MIHVTTPCPHCGGQMAGEAEQLLRVVLTCHACGNQERVSENTIREIERMMEERENARKRFGGVLTQQRPSGDEK